MRACVWAFVSVVAVESRETLFYAFGDWGEDRHEFRQTVAQLHAQPRPRFVGLLGDSFYPRGVRSAHDPQFRLFDAFSDISDSFYVALGNHDYGYSESVGALIAHSDVDAKWVMPSQYFMKRMPLGDNRELCVFVLDTHVFEPAQLRWLRDSLGSCQSGNAFRVIFTHYPLLSVGLYAYESKVTRLQGLLFPLIRDFGVHAYVSGHEHQMQAFEKNGVHYLISGATAQMNRNKRGHPEAWRNELKFVEHNDAGFLAFTLEDDSTLSYKFIRASDGRQLYGATIPLTISRPHAPSVPVTSARPVVPATSRNGRDNDNSKTDQSSTSEGRSSDVKGTLSTTDDNSGTAGWVCSTPIAVYLFALFSV